MAHVTYTFDGKCFRRSPGECIDLKKDGDN